MLTKLRQRGLSRELAGTAVAELGQGEAEQVRARAAAEKFLRRAGGASGELRQKLYRHLYGKGFDRDLCRAVTEELVLAGAESDESS